MHKSRKEEELERIKPEADWKLEISHTAEFVEEKGARPYYVTKASGGKSVVRPLAKLILSAQGKWEKAIERLTMTI